MTRGPAEFAELLAFGDALKLAVREAVAATFRTGRRSILVTGDNREVATSTLGVDEFVAEVLPGGKAEIAAAVRRRR